MTGYLYYRIPDNAKIRITGEFEEINIQDDFNGFIVSQFKGDKRFVFVENKQLDREAEVKTPFVISKEAYLKKAEEIISVLQSGELEKLVYSRVEEYETSINSDILFDQLCDDHPNAFVYCFHSALLGSWIGATPEVIIKSTAENYTTMALAGTKRIEESWSEKEILEQQMVVDFIKEKLIATQSEIVEISDTTDHLAGDIKHLKTNFIFKLKENELNFLLSNLHPTPAVSGIPQKEAIEFILNNEAHDRNLYTGFIGIKDESSCALFVNLRCAQIRSDKYFLYVGGGFTKDSNALAEWQETKNKAGTIISSIEKCIQS